MACAFLGPGLLYYFCISSSISETIRRKRRRKERPFLIPHLGESKRSANCKGWESTNRRPTRGQRGFYGMVPRALGHTLRTRTYHTTHFFFLLFTALSKVRLLHQIRSDQGRVSISIVKCYDGNSTQEAHLHICRSTLPLPFIYLSIRAGPFPYRSE